MRTLNLVILSTLALSSPALASPDYQCKDNRVEKVRLVILRAGKTQELYWDTTR